MSNALTQFISRIYLSLSNSTPDSSKRVVPNHVSDSLGKFIDRLDSLFHKDDKSTGQPSECAVDDIVLGLHPGSLVVLAARPSMGISAFSMRFIERALLHKAKSVLVFSLMMSAESTVVQLLSLFSKIDPSKLRHGNLEDEDWPRLTEAVARLKDSKLYIDEYSTISIAEIRERTQRINIKYGDLSLIIIDNLQNIKLKKTHKNDASNSISDLSQSLKILAIDFNCSVVVLSELNRELELRANKRPMISDLGEFEIMYRDADLVMHLYRDGLYNQDSHHKDVTEILIEKNMHGPVGTYRIRE